MRDNPELKEKDISATMRKKWCAGDVYTELSSLECITKASTGDSGVGGVDRCMSISQLSQDSISELHKVTTDPEFALAQAFDYDSDWPGSMELAAKLM